MFVAVGPTWTSALEAALKATKNYAHLRIAEDTQKPARIQSVYADQYDFTSWYDGFTYCTWNGLGQHLTPDKILDYLEVLSKNGIEISNLIIDDNWQSLDFSGVDNFYHRWTGFEANAENFPGDLKELISEIRKRHPHIVDIAV